MKKILVVLGALGLLSAGDEFCSISTEHFTSICHKNKLYVSDHGTLEASQYGIAKDMEFKCECMVGKDGHIEIYVDEEDKD